MEPFTRRLNRALPAVVQPLEPGPGIVCLAEADPVNFWSRFLGALANRRTIACLNTDWPEAWLKQLRRQARQFPQAHQPTILIPTSGSTGLPKFCIHDLDTLLSAAEGFAGQFGDSGVINNVNVLPQHHVGGMMPVMRSAVCGGTTHFADYKDPAGILDAPFSLDSASISIVPTQLARMLTDQKLTAVLQSLGMVLAGGAGCSGELLKDARAKHLRLAPCYGSTETAAMVTILDPEAFLAGAEGVGRALPHASVAVTPQGRVRVTSRSNCHGYWPAVPGYKSEYHETNDLGRIDDSGSLHILGRLDRVIISGGEKVIPEKVEAAAMASGLVKDVLCHGVPDPDWGMRVELQFVQSEKSDNIVPALNRWLKDQLPAFAVPKSMQQVDQIARDTMGKSVQNPHS